MKKLNRYEKLAKKKSKKLKNKKSSKPSISKLKKEADRVFSLYIRNRDKGVCFTCGVKKPIKSMHAGHYITRNYLAVRYDEVNVHCQCVGCNVFKKGNYTEYARNLLKKHGYKILGILHEKSRETIHNSRQLYNDIIERYKCTT